MFQNIFFYYFFIFSIFQNLHLLTFIFSKVVESILLRECRVRMCSPPTSIVGLTVLTAGGGRRGRNRGIAPSLRTSGSSGVVALLKESREREKKKKAVNTAFGHATEGRRQATAEPSRL